MPEKKSPSPEPDHRVKPEDLPPGVELRPHEYDGIQEYDQRLPNWWLWTFYGAIIWFAIFWVGYYQLGIGRNDSGRIGEHMRMVAAKQAEELERMFAADPDGTLWKMSRNEVTVDAGKAHFDARCVQCHASDLTAMQDGIKLPGLPLHDDEWKYGGDPFSPMNVFGIVKDGSPDKTAGMQAWLNELGPKGVAEVTAYVLSYHEPPEGALEEKPTDSRSGDEAAPGPSDSPATAFVP